MPKYPLLLFPAPVLVDRTSKASVPKKYHVPSVERQEQRLGPIFRQLQNAFDARRVELQQTATGIEPEQVLVIETVDGVDKFINAVKRIPGLEWMGELDHDEISPDKDFYDEKNRDKKLNGRLYLIISNHQALRQMLSLWEDYQKNPKMKFGYGLTKFRDVFMHTKDIHPWGVEDRLFETGVLEYWQEDLECFGERPIIFETELWFRNKDSLRTASAAHVSSLIEQAGGRILGQSVIEGIAYHGLLAELPAQAIRTIIEDPSTELVKCDQIMFFRPSGQMVAGTPLSVDNVELLQTEERPLPQGEPILALLDGLPLANHTLLAGRLVVDDPDNLTDTYTASERVHGSAMASLIIHGDLTRPQPPLSRPIYVRPIMTPYRGPNKMTEEIPRTYLMVDLFHRAVMRLFEGEEGQEGVSPYIKIINISIGDPSRQFTQTMSPLARLLDWLSAKYNVLFIVSSGNNLDYITLDVQKQNLESLPPEELESQIIHALYNEGWKRQLLSPAETINGITVGAIHQDDVQDFNLGNRLNPFVHLLPSPISSFGSGYRRSIKPDILFPGGRQLYRAVPTSSPNAVIAPTPFHSAPGNKVASPGSGGGQLNGTVYSCGTSNATALLSREACICYDLLKQFFQERGYEGIPAGYEVPLLKAMLVHGSSWYEMGTRLSHILRNSENGRRLRKMCSRWLGYGLPNFDRVRDCTGQRATVFGYGELTDGKAHIFSLPLPASLYGQPIQRRLTVTLAWLSPIAPKTQKYRTASLWLEFDGDFDTSRQNVDSKASQRGTIQHEILIDKRSIPIGEVGDLSLKVNCRQDASKIVSPIPYSLFVTLEIADELDIDIYTEIRTRIPQKVQV